MENGHQTQPMLCLTMCAYRREGMDEEDYRKYMTDVHAPLVKNLMVKHGIDKYSMVSQIPYDATLRMEYGKKRESAKDSNVS
jgi:hypothetical protein